ncbi:MAG TPA: DUF4232 domain-containing protein [Baekduia sp.]|uniref:DUF4232 domain-containing protein n=1 Tax=Baekduia sp. TaxID=2600305 RepID=UPI002D78B2B0|nr:DUF4232 domain-containing protein [Baekduia sp.]HET6507359.1 DUF4232 domain-containing protein [Baekduia sp.]
MRLLPTTLLAAGTLALVAAAPTAGATRTSTRTPTCRTSNLHVALAASPGGQAAGSTFELLTFTNTGKASCAMVGFPGVSFVTGPNGRQVGAAAQRTAGVAVRRVVLAPRARAVATLRVAHAADFPPTRCRAQKVAGLRVFPPNTRTTAFVSRRGFACSMRVARQLSVTAVSAA